MKARKEMDRWGDHSPHAIQAVRDGRVLFCELWYYEYLGNAYGKDIFRNMVTGGYLD